MQRGFGMSLLAPVFLSAIAVVTTSSRPVHAAEKIALIPLETLGARAKVSRKTQRAIVRALASVPEFQLVDAKKIRRAQSKKPALRACDGKANCLAELGREVGARYVVYGEVGGLGEVELVYLKVVDAQSGQELRSTTVELGNPSQTQRARAAAFRLLAPERYVGTLALRLDVSGAAIYVDGRQVARSPSKPVALSVGTHALRVTHPEFRDYVRFVDIAFDERNEIAVDLHKYATVSSDIARDPTSAKPDAGGVIYRDGEPTPWYRRWYTVAGFGAAVLVTSAIVAGLIANGIDADKQVTVDNPR